MAMTYQRQEGFRYAFTPPLQTTVELMVLNGDTYEIEQGASGLILDISLKGAKIAIPMDLPIENHRVNLALTFEMNHGSPFKVKGHPIWKNRTIRDYQYGILFDPASYSPDSLLQEIKFFAKTHRK